MTDRTLNLKEGTMLLAPTILFYVHMMAVNEPEYLRFILLPTIGFISIFFLLVVAIIVLKSSMTRRRINVIYRRIMKLTKQQVFYLFIGLLFAPGTGWNDIISNGLISKPVGSLFESIGLSYWLGYIVSYFLTSLIGVFAFTKLRAKISFMEQIKMTVFGFVIWLYIMYILNLTFGWFAEITLLF